MKKLTTLIALALVLTIGGVYAAWTYFQGGATGAIAHPRIGMATISYNGEKGTITADTTGITLLVDDMSTVLTTDANATYESHQAGITGVGKIVVNFTAKQGADADVVANGIRMNAIISIKPLNDASKYEGKTPLKVNEQKAEFEITLGTAAKTAEISCDKIIAALVLNEGAKLILDTKAKYEDFAAALSDYQIHIQIVEYTPPTAS